MDFVFIHDLLVDFLACLVSSTILDTSDEADGLCSSGSCNKSTPNKLADVEKQPFRMALNCLRLFSTFA